MKAQAASQNAPDIACLINLTHMAYHRPSYEISCLLHVETYALMKE